MMDDTFWNTVFVTDHHYIILVTVPTPDHASSEYVRTNTGYLTVMSSTLRGSGAPVNESKSAS